MNLSPYTTSGRYLFWSCIGRCLGPLVYGKMLTDYPFQVVIKLTLAIIIAILICFYYYGNNIFFQLLNNLFKIAKTLEVEQDTLMDEYLKFITRKDYKDFFLNLKKENNWTYKNIEESLGLNSSSYIRYLKGYKISRENFVKLKKALYKLNLMNTLLP